MSKDAHTKKIKQLLQGQFLMSELFSWQGINKHLGRRKRKKKPPMNSSGVGDLRISTQRSPVLDTAKEMR